MKGKISLFADRHIAEGVRTGDWPRPLLEMFMNMLPYVVVATPRTKPLCRRQGSVTETKGAVAWTHKGVTVRNGPAPLRTPVAEM